MEIKKFYDTSTLLTSFADLKNVVISSKTIEELESIKVSANKDDAIKYAARQATRAIKEQNPEVVIVLQDDYAKLKDMNLEVSNDNLITACAARYMETSDIEFWSEDFLCGLIAGSLFGLSIKSVGDKPTEIYKGYKIVSPDDNTLSQIYDKDNSENVFGCNVNEYAIIKDCEDATLDIVKWSGFGYIPLNNKTFKSRTFGNIKPLDEIQRCAFDSILTNDITVLTGRAGSGKTTLPLAYITQCLETQKFSKCYIVHHFETLKGAKTLGYVKGTQLEKKLQTSSIGGILASKYGDMSDVERMISSGMIEIVSTADLRGVEFDAESCVFSTESQDLDAYSLKTLIQRCKTGCKVILEGDIIDQCDTNRGIGLFKMIDVFKGHKSFGCVKLKNNYRSEISELADKI